MFHNSARKRLSMLVRSLLTTHTEIEFKRIYAEI